MDRKYMFYNIIRRSFDFLAKNLFTFIKCAFFPVVMQILGIILSLFPCIFLTVIQKLNGEALIPYIIPMLICLIVGIILFCIGFWKYLLLSCYFTLGTNDYDENKGFYLQIYKNDILKRQGNYAKVLLWAALFGILIFVAGMLIVFAVSYNIAKQALPSILAMAILLMTVALIWYYVKITFIVPIFTMEKDLKPYDVFLKSFNMIKGSKFWFIFALGLVVNIITIILELIFAFLASFICSFFISENFIQSITNLVSSLVYVLLFPFITSVVMLAYKRMTVNQ